MKNIILVLSLFFVLGATAQNKKIATSKKEVVKEKVSAEVAAQKNVTDLNAFTPLSDNMKASMLELFTTKYRMLDGSEAYSAERKQYVSDIIGQKLQSTLDAVTFEKIKANATLYKSLVN